MRKKGASMDHAVWMALRFLFDALDLKTQKEVSDHFIWLIESKEKLKIAERKQHRDNKSAQTK